MTTIKVPSELRDRLVARARQDNQTMAAVIARALDDAEEREFWERVRAENAQTTFFASTFSLRRLLAR